MNIFEITKQQWIDFSTYHASRRNLIIHLFAVPTFIIGLILFVYGLVNLGLIETLDAILIMAISLGVQSYGHSNEEVRSSSFAGPIDALTRILLEQLINYPRFLLTGKWYAALRTSKNH
ncbi:MAG: terminase [Gammaproteobacteria bacterium]